MIGTATIVSVEPAELVLSGESPDGIRRWLHDELTRVDYFGVDRTAPFQLPYVPAPPKSAYPARRRRKRDRIVLS